MGNLRRIFANLSSFTDPSPHVHFLLWEMVQNFENCYNCHEKGNGHFFGWLTDDKKCEMRLNGRAFGGKLSSSFSLLLPLLFSFFSLYKKNRSSIHSKAENSFSLSELCVPSLTPRFGKLKLTPVISICVVYFHDFTTHPLALRSVPHTHICAAWLHSACE